MPLLVNDTSKGVGSPRSRGSRFSYHGLTVESSLPLPLEREGAGGVSGPAALVVRPEPGLGSPEGPALLTSAATGYRLHSDGRSRCWLVKEGAAFLVTTDQILVDPVPLDSERACYLVTRVLALWLQLTGRPALHASAVAFGERAVGLMARSGTGKSTLASALVQRGAQLLCDDLLPVTFEGDSLRISAAEPYIKLWPDSAGRLVPDLETLERVVPSIEKRKLPARPADGSGRGRPSLERLYVLEREPNGGGEVRIEEFPAAEALMMLLGHGQMAGAAEALGLGGARLEVLARVVRRVPVRLVRFPSSFDALPHVCAAIESDASS
jgi:hypothetical protein